MAFVTEPVRDRKPTRGPAPAPPAPSGGGLAARCSGTGTSSRCEAPGGGTSARPPGTRDGSSLSGGDAAAASQGTPRVNFGSWAAPDAQSKPLGEPPKLNLGEGELLRAGSRGDNVRQLQEMLKSRGAKLEADGEFGPQTRRAVRNFQRRNGLGVDGIVGPETQGALNGTGGQPRVDGNGSGRPAGETSNGRDTSAPAGQGRFAHTRQDLERLPARLRPYADAFQRAGEKYGIDPRFLAAISVQETGGGRSSAFRNKNNAMGVMGRNGTRRFSSVEASIDTMARNLARPDGYYRGRSTISQIGSVYAPIGAANDPRGLNNHWVRGVSRFYRMLGGDPSERVILR